MTASYITYWCLAVAPGLPYFFLYLGYRPTLAHKRRALANLISKGRVEEAYKARFGDDGPGLQRLFDQSYHWSAYILAIVLNVIVIAAAVAMSFGRSGISLGFPRELADTLKYVPITFVFGFFGAYMLGTYTVLQRYRTHDLSPSSLHFVWLHMVLASVLAPLFTRAFAASLADVTAFGVGVFPLKDSLDWAREFTKRRLKIVAAATPGEEPTLQNLQGLTTDVIERLAEEGITTTVELAYSNPIKLLLKTNFEWAFIIDIIDQALLFNYLRDIKDGAARIRPLGIRGSIEMATLGEVLPDGQANPKTEEPASFSPERVRQALGMVAERLGLSVNAVRNLAIDLWEDGQLDLICELFETFEHSAGGSCPSTSLPPERAAI